MSSIFSKIINGEIPCFQIAENEEFFSFLDIRPMTLGHALVIPKKEIDYIFDMEDERYVRMFLYAKKIAKAIETIVPCKKVGMAVVGLEVPHAHIHLVPLNEVGDMVFGKSITVETEKMKKLAEDIALALQS
jgi:histidine triad (HIT) family protein